MITELLTDPSRSRSDLRMIAMSIRNNWVIPQQLMEALPKLMTVIALKGKPRDQVAAAKVLMAMKEQNEKTGQPQQIEHHHTHDIGPVTEDNIEAQRAIRLARLAGRV